MVNKLLNDVERHFLELRKTGGLTDTKRTKLIGAIEALRAAKYGIEAKWLFKILKIEV